jgi:hypothetical protein
MARWYDTIPVVWVKSIQDIMNEFELDHWTKIVAGVEVEKDAKPFAASLLSSFHSPSPEGVAAFLSESEQSLAVVKALRGSSAWQARFQQYNEGFIERLMVVLRNHQWADSQGWSDDRKQRETKVNIRRVLWEGAAEADRRLTARGDVAYAKKERTLREVQAGLLEIYDREPKSLPLMRVM